jgi:hypothetical protein
VAKSFPKEMDMLIAVVLFVAILSGLRRDIYVVLLKTPVTKTRENTVLINADFQINIHPL